MPVKPTLWVGSGPQGQGPVVIARVGMHCQKDKCAATTWRVRAIAGQDCAELSVSYPFDHSGGQ